jgi:hypothetical protein
VDTLRPHRDVDAIGQARARSRQRDHVRGHVLKVSVDTHKGRGEREGD